MKGQKSIPLLLVAAGLAAYHNIFQNPFIFDDLPQIVENPRIRHLWPPWGILAGSSRPLVDLSLAMNYALGGLNPWGYHAFNVAIHILAALTLYGVVRRILLSEPLRSSCEAVAAVWLAAVAALIWLVHPLQTESVTYTIQRAESLMGLFYLLTLYCVIRGCEPSRDIGWMTGAVLACALGMASKEVMVTAPVVVLLFDRVFLARSWREIIQRRWALYVGLAATWLLLPLLMGVGAKGQVSGWQPTAGFGFKGITPFQYALTQPGVILHYLRLAFWPYPLCLDYGSIYGWPVAQTAADVWPELLVLGGLAAATVWVLRRKPALGFLGAWFLIILAPTSSFIPIVGLVFEHRMYLSLAAVAVGMVIGAYALGKRFLNQPGNFRPMFGWGAAGVVICFLTCLTMQRNLDYRSELAIWQDTVDKCPNNPLALFNLGNAFWKAGSLQEAVPLWEEALRIKPDYAEVHANLGIASSQAGKIEDAVRHYEQALRYNPNLVEAHNNLGYDLARSGRIPEAITHYRQALQIKPEYALAMNNLAFVLATLPPAQGGDAGEALSLAQRACALTGNRVAADLDTLAIAYAAQGRFSEAIPTAQQALDLARTAGLTQFASQIETRVELYRSGRPYSQHS